MMIVDLLAEKKFVITKNSLIKNKCRGDDALALHRANYDHHCYQMLSAI